jgi:hypothetical protein
MNMTMNEASCPVCKAECSSFSDTFECKHCGCVFRILKRNRWYKKIAPPVEDQKIYTYDGPPVILRFSPGANLEPDRRL